MTGIQEIEKAIATLPRDEFFQLRERIQRRFDAQWDEEFEADASTGRLDRVAEEAMAEHRSGLSKPFPTDAK